MCPERTSQLLVAEGRYIQSAHAPEAVFVLVARCPGRLFKLHLAQSGAQNEGLS